MASCKSPPEVAYGYVSYDSLAGGATWADTKDVLYKCFKFYALVGSDKMTCNNGLWTGTLPKCEYHQDTEIVFSFVLAMIIILTLVVLALLIFICCYFCRCCNKCGKGKGGKNRQDSSRNTGKRPSYKPI